MKRIERALSLLHEIDMLYKSVIDGTEVENKTMDTLISELLEFEHMESIEPEEQAILAAIIQNFTSKVELINQITAFKSDIDERLTELSQEFQILEARRFEIINNYVVGTVKKEDLDTFKNLLFKFRTKLYAIPISDNNILTIAKMKSKIQHFETEVLEDEEVLKVAYSNSNDL